jgi:hypothetical protein
MKGKQLNIFLLQTDWEKITAYLTKNAWWILPTKDNDKQSILADHKLKTYYLAREKNEGNNIFDNDVIEITVGIENDNSVTASRFFYYDSAVKKDDFEKKDDVFLQSAARLFSFLRRNSRKNEHLAAFRMSENAKMKTLVYA